jgi:hypothetical protein
VRWIEMAEIGRQDRCPRTRIIAIAVGIKDGVDAKIMQPRRH